jgi:hypothetical protein
LFLIDFREEKDRRGGGAEARGCWGCAGCRRRRCEGGEEDEDEDEDDEESV